MISFDAFGTICTLTPTHWLNLVIEQIDTRITAFNPQELREQLLCKNASAIEIITSLGLINQKDHTFIKKISDLITEEQKSVSLLPFSKEVIEDLASKYAIAITSNLGHGYGSELLKQLPPVNYKIFSYVEGYKKPSSKIFERLVTVSQLEPCQILHVGDKFTNDYIGASAAGLKALHLDWDKTSTADNSRCINHITDVLYHLS